MNNSIIKTMADIVEKKVKNYKTDFYNYDVDTLKNNIDENSQYLWVIRENGTNLFYIPICRVTDDFYEYVNTTIDFYYKQDKPTFYIVSNNGVKNIRYKTAKKMFAA